MPNKTPIEWTDYSSNAIYAVSLETGKRGWHCVHVGPDCANCYAEAINKRFGTGLAYIAQNDSKARFELSMKECDALLRLDSRLQKQEETKRCFVGDMLDIFHRDIPDKLLDELFGLFERFTNLIIQVLTKRTDRACEYLSKRWANKTPPAHIHIGCSAGNQKTFDERWPYLRQTPAAIRFLSLEPLLGPIDLPLAYCLNCLKYVAFKLVNSGKDYGCVNCGSYINRMSPANRPGGFYEVAPLHWVIVGGESGAHARPMHPDWARSLRDQCEQSGVAFFFKQWGEYVPESVFPSMPMTKKLVSLSPDSQFPNEVVGRVGKKIAGRLLDGREHNSMPQPTTGAGRGRR